MSAPAKVITHGTGPVLRDWNFLDSVSGPDEITFLAQNCSAVNTYRRGDQVPGYSSIRIVEARARLVPGSQYDITCRGRGLITGTSRVIRANLRTTIDGWDELGEQRMEKKSQTVPDFGTAHPLHSKMFLMAAAQDESLDIGDGTSDWVVRDRSYRGMATGTVKRITRKITVNENIVSPSDPIFVDLPGGWTDARKSQVSFPRIVVADTILTIVPPPTVVIPGAATPVDPPSIQSIYVVGSDLTYNWPHDWKLSNIDSQELFHGAGVYLQTLTYEYVWPVQF